MIATSTIKCTQCPSTFLNVSERRKHLRKVHSTRLDRTCCGETFKTLREKRKHDRATHSKPPAASLSASKEAAPKQPVPTDHKPPSTTTALTATNAQSTEVLLTAPDGKELILYYSGWHPFSNFHTAPFYVDGVCYRTVEHYYQAEKARYFQDYAQQWNILNTWTPLSAKRLGSSVKLYDADRWGEISYKVMCYGVREKIRQNSSIEQKLLSTANKLIAEGTRYDHFWGIGMDLRDPDAIHYQKWPGYNAMGNILMEIRSEIFNQSV